jgi:hypothetical protein
VSLERIAMRHSVAALSLAAAVEGNIVSQLQDPAERAQQAERLISLTEAAAESGHLAVVVASGGLLSLLLQTAAELARSSEDDAPQQACELLDGLGRLVEFLANATSSAVDNATETGMPDSLAAKLKQAARALRQQRQQVLAGLGSDASLADRADQLWHLVQPAADAVTLLHQWLKLPGTIKQQQLVASQAAAARSCAYLRCANVAGQGGPAAGQGVGSMRCSACHAVWYCGTACSHADWRAGHKRMCELLAAERQAAKAARAAGAAAQAAKLQ